MHISDGALSHTSRQRIEARAAEAVWTLPHAARYASSMRSHIVTRCNFARGGHFPAWEQPVLYAEDLRQIESTVRP